MSKVLLALPLIVSTFFFISSVAFYMMLPSLIKDINVPPSEKETFTERKIIDNLAKVFPEIKEEEEKRRTVAEVKVNTKRKDINIQLLGLSYGSKSMALLKINGNVFVLEEGEEYENVKLVKVNPDGVMIRINGEILKLRIESAKEEVKTAERERGEYGKKEEGIFVRISRREIERLTRDPGIMFREIRLVPYVKNGRTEGFIFEWIKPGSLLHRIGLRRGDILVSINNMTIRSGEDAFRILQLLRNESSLKVVVLRNGQRKEINIRIE